MGSGDVTGVEVDQLHTVGRTIGGRAGGGRAAARNLGTGLDSASGGIGHAVVKGAISKYVSDHLVDDGILLGHQLEAGGANVANVAATARAGDEQAAHDLQSVIAPTTDLNDRINRQV